MDAGNADQRIPARTVIWAAGVTASPLAAARPRSGAELDRAGRVTVEPDLTLPGHPEIFALGDMVRVREPMAAPRPPGVAPVAMQQGRYAADRSAIGCAARMCRRSNYHDKGNLATIGRAAAVADIGGYG